jgi:hypothetical protein
VNSESFNPHGLFPAKYESVVNDILNLSADLKKSCIGFFFSWNCNFLFTMMYRLQGGQNSSSYPSEIFDIMSQVNSLRRVFDCCFNTGDAEDTTLKIHDY